MFLLVYFSQTWGLGSLFEARSWEEIGTRIPTQNIYKPRVHIRHRDVHIFIMMMILWILKPFLCREAIEEVNFAGQFQKLRSTFFSLFSCVGFLTSNKTQKNYFVILLTLFWCTFEYLREIRKPHSLIRRPIDTGNLVELINFLLWFVVLCAYILIYISLWWLL